MSKTISFALDYDSISRAVKEYDAYRKSFMEKTDEVAKRFSERIKVYADNAYASAIADITSFDKGAFEIRNADVTVTVQKEGDKTYLVVASGEDAIFVEFGSGVMTNGPVGSSSNPWGAENGYTIGSFSKPQNVGKKAWVIDSNKYSTLWGHGTPTQRVLYEATQNAINDLPDIVQEVFAFG